LLVTRLRQAWPSVRITIRGDSAFCRWRLMRWCETNDIRYIFGLGRNSVLERVASEWTAQAQTAHDLDGQTHRTFGTFSYAAQTWDRSRRVIVKAEHLCGPDGGRANPRYIVTNLAGEPWALYEDVYCQRGDRENRIKEQQLGLFADRTSCHGFLANQFRVLLAAFAYVLIEQIRRTALVGTELATAQVSTIRLRLFRVAALVVVSVRRVLVNFAASFVSRDLFVRVANRLMQKGSILNSS
jgi:Transposase DDE domain group 1